MLQETSLNGTWDLSHDILSFPLSETARLQNRADGWMPAVVPGDIHQALIAAGTISEPLVGMRSDDCRWTEERSWWYRKSFPVDDAALQFDTVELELNGLDSNAEIFLNGVHIGSHRNAFRPFVKPVKQYLVPGTNILLVRLSTGVETVTDAGIDEPDGVRAGTEAGNGRPERGDPRRTMVRKPQYSFGWDWSPRVATTAIAGDVILRAISGVCIRDVRIVPDYGPTDDAVTLHIVLLADYQHYFRTCEGMAQVTLTDAAGELFQASQPALFRSGHTYVAFALVIPAARLWWPNGMGEQHRYRVDAHVEVNGERTAYAPFYYGIRFLELDTKDCFAICLNNHRVFSKGGNWIPVDTLYARADAARYDSLIREARDANFNMLRIWGGGLYESEAFYDACDRYGILVWHDFMFACAPYPDHLEWFQREIELEADYQTRRLRRYACIALWSGSNENNWGFHEWWGGRTQGGAWCYNVALPDIVQRNCPEIPYWNGSPYGGEAPNGEDVGDTHHWRPCMMNPDMNKRITPEEYDKCNSLFVSEYGYIGACVRESVETYLDGPMDRSSAAWHHHTNTFEKDTVEAGIRKHYIDPEDLDIDEYLHFSGLCQGLMYAYSLESMRFRANCHGALFWMYNDCWGELGWSIIDYYLRRKPSWYFVRRAFAPLRLILRPDGPDHIQVIVANDTLQPCSLPIEMGYVALDGCFSDVTLERVEAAPMMRTPAGRFARGEHDPAKGVWMARCPDREEVLAALFRAVDYRMLQIVEPGLEVDSLSADASDVLALRISAAAFAHGVTLTLPDGYVPSDNYFDLLPGEARTIAIAGPTVLSVRDIPVTWYGCR